MTTIVKQATSKPKVRHRIFAYAIGREMTHGIIWAFTPFLLMAGIPLKYASLAWVLNSLAAIVGTRLAKRYIIRLRDWQILAVPLGLMIISTFVLSVAINPWTISFYLLLGVVQGWTGTSLMPILQEHVAPEVQTSVISLAKIVSQIIYVLVVFLIGLATDIKLNYAALATLLIFAPLGIMLVIKLARE